MKITNITDYDNISSSNYSDYDNITDYDNMTTYNCTKNENDIDVIIPDLLFTIPYGLLFLCLISFLVYTLIKPLINKK